MFGSAVAVSRLHIRTSPNCGSIAALKTFKQCLFQEVPQCKTQQSMSGIRNFTNWRTLVSKKSPRNDVGWDNKLRRTMSLFWPKVKIPGEKQPPPIETNPLKVNTKVKNNVMLYRFEKPYLYKGSILFGGAALVGCITMADNVYLVLCRDLFNPEKPWLTRIIEHMLPIAFIVIGVIAGPGIFATIWHITKRTVKYIVLHKGGKTVTIITYHPFKGEKTMSVPVHNISATFGRTGPKSHVPLRIKDTRLKLLVDKAGHFVNPELFDVTVGVKRFE